MLGNMRSASLYNENCKKLLKCGHRCIGICGEPCLRICSQCHKDKFKELQEILFGFEDDPKARFLQLPDCGHIFEREGFDNYVDHSLRQSSEGDKADVKLLVCPKCNRPILTCQRYGNILKAKFADVQSVKRKIHGDPEELDSQRNKLIDQIDDDVSFVNDKTTEAFGKVFGELKNYLKNNSVAQLSREKISRMTNLIEFMKRLRKLNANVEKNFWLNIRRRFSGFRSPVGSEKLSWTIQSPILLEFLKR